MSFQPIQAEVDRWITSLPRGYYEPLPMMARLTEEVGELARAVMHRYGGKPPKAGEDPGEIGDEIADSIFVLVCMANSLGIDLDQAFGAMMTKIRTRDANRWSSSS